MHSDRETSGLIGIRYPCGYLCVAAWMYWTPTPVPGAQCGAALQRSPPCCVPGESRKEACHLPTSHVSMGIVHGRFYVTVLLRKY